MDFTLQKYRQLVETVLAAGYDVRPYGEYRRGTAHRCVYLRHDVDLRPANSLATARIEHALGARATYYFRAVPQSWDESVIREISSLGHEIGYHYESLTTCNGDMSAAFEDFCSNLARLRELAPVRTVCMHGSPKSRFDSRDLWNTHSLEELGIIAEPYLTTDWSEVFYLTDTGRRWDGFKVSVRDRIPEWQDRWIEAGLVFHSTDEIIAGVGGRLPETIMITTHPQRWTDSPLLWLREFLLQNLKNIVKRFVAGK